MSEVLLANPVTWGVTQYIICIQEAHHVEPCEQQYSPETGGALCSSAHVAEFYICVSTKDFFFFSSHGMSYPISGLVKTYKAKEYNVDHPLVVKTFSNKSLD